MSYVQGASKTFAIEIVKIKVISIDIKDKNKSTIKLNEQIKK